MRLSWWSSVLLTVCLISFSSSYELTSDPIPPDNSEQCLSCQSTIQEMYTKWTDPKNVEAILRDLKRQCRTNQDSIAKKAICSKLVEVLVQIPPGLFEGMEDLAWPIPLAPCALIRQCKVQCCAAESPPEQVHLSLPTLNGEDTAYWGVSWVTLDSNASVVTYGTDPNDLNIKSVGTIDTYTQAGWVGTIHRAKMSELKHSETYYYRVGDGDKWSDTYSFRTFDSGSQDLTYAVIADMDFEQNDTVKQLNNMVENGEIQAVIHSGDIGYADGFEPHWDVFFNHVESIASKIPYMVTPGNHEFWFNFSAYKHRFYMPGTLDEGGSGDNMFFSWDLGYTHFIALNSETAVDTANFAGDEIEWVRQNLAAVDRSKTPWIVAHFHRPMYCSSDHACGDKGSEKLRQQMEDVFKEYGVDLVLSGHVHAYQRTYPVYNNALVTTSYSSPGAPVYIMQGASGNREGNKGGYPDPSELPDWSATTSTEIGYGVMSISATEISWGFYSSATADLLDHFVISK